MAVKTSQSKVEGQQGTDQLGKEGSISSWTTEEKTQEKFLFRIIRNNQNHHLHRKIVSSFFSFSSF